jgi:GTP-binding protein
MSDAPIVAIVGRPNVGKSTLFNRLVGRRRAITLDTPGVTRDPIRVEVEWQSRTLTLVDTGGLGGEAEIALADRVHEHTVAAIRGAALVVVVFDARAGLLPADRDTIDLLKRTGVPFVCVANKCDGPKQEQDTAEFCALGIDPPLPVSAEHGLGIGELKERIVDALGSRAEPAGEHTDDSSAGEDTSSDRPCRVAIVGRPNVGKSSLLNAIAGAELSLVDDRPGTTRDVVDTAIAHDGKYYVLLDTAGMRRPSRVQLGVERSSVGRTLEAIRRCDVALLLVEPTEGVTDQEARIAQRVLEDGRALVIALNKVDLLPRAVARDELRGEVAGRYATLGIAEFETLSAKSGQGIDRVFRAVDRAFRAWTLEVQTSALNRCLQDILAQREPPVLGRGRLRIFYVTQTGTRPPAFTFFANRESVPTEYRRFVENGLRASLPLRGTPIRLRFQRRPSHGVLRE